MPYIEAQRRKEITEQFAKGMNLDAPHVLEGYSPGDFNYLVTKLAIKYMEHNGTNYTNCNQVMGILASAKQEFYRRLVAPYEDKKIEENGDVY